MSCSDSHPRLIDEAKAKKLEADLGIKCRYYETCATYGLNVEHVFQDGMAVIFCNLVNSQLLLKD